MRRVRKTRSILGGALRLAMGACLAVLAGCGGASSADEAKVRALFSTVAAQGRAHRFTTICQHEISGVIRQLDYLVGGNCEEDLAREWAEGVQLETITSETRIAVRGSVAIVYDGPTPDRARRVAGRWLVSELPRNKRLAEPNEAQRVLAQINAAARARHEPTINSETGSPER